MAPMADIRVVLAITAMFQEDIIEYAPLKAILSGLMPTTISPFWVSLVLSSIGICVAAGSLPCKF
jgi:hypothetical protein